MALSSRWLLSFPLGLAAVAVAMQLRPPSAGAQSASRRAPSQHRAQAGCAATRGPSTPFQRPVRADCQRDADCTQGRNGRCTAVYMGRGGSMLQCSYDRCQSDSECSRGQLCNCGHDATSAGVGHACVQSNCRVDGDCGRGGFCSPSQAHCGGGGATGYFCHTSRDECIDTQDCRRDGGYGECTYSPLSQRWQCDSTPCPPG